MIKELVFVDFPVDTLSFRPFTYTRPIANLLLGINKIDIKWAERLNLSKFSYLTENHLYPKFSKPQKNSLKPNYLYINSIFLPYQKESINGIQSLHIGESLYFEGTFLALHSSELIDNLAVFFKKVLESSKKQLLEEPVLLKNSLDLFKKNGLAIQKDFTFLTQNRKSEDFEDPHTVCYGKDYIFIEKGAKVYNSTLIADRDSPIYIGKDTVIEANSVIKGAFVLGEKSQLNMGSKIKGDTSIGQSCKIGGELSNVIINDYSNKGHDGFLGNAVLGQWCNLGAGTNASNLKNNYSFIKLWDYTSQDFIQTQEQFCGLLMGDHSKTGIGTTFNTATVVGVGVNIFGAGFPPKYIPSFSWGGVEGFQKFDFEKFCLMAKNMMERRKIKFHKIEEQLFKYIFQKED